MNEDKITANGTLDFIGFFCPEPVFRTRVELDQMKSEVLEVLADDPAAEEDIKNLVKWTGHKLLKMSQKGEFLRFFIKKV